jgi:GTPase SAR1 family protein
VGLKKDLRDDPLTLEELKSRACKPISHEQGLALMQDIGALKYFETSAKTGEGVKELFQAAAKLSLQTYRKKLTKCNFL